MQEFFKLTADNEIPVSAVNSKYSQVIFCQPAHLFDPNVEVLGCFIDGEHIFFVYRNFLISHDSCLLSLSFYQYSPSWRLFFRSETKKDLQILRKEPAGLLPLYFNNKHHTVCSLLMPFIVSYSSAYFIFDLKKAAKTNRLPK